MQRLDAPTRVALIAVDAAGENQIAVASGANAALAAEAVEAALDGAAAGGVALLALEVPDAAVLAGARAARAAGLTVVINPAPARPWRRAVALAPILTPNGGEAAALSGEDDPEAAARALAERTGAPVVVTVGADGALLVADGASSASRRPPVEAVEPPAPATPSTARSPPRWPAARRCRRGARGRRGRAESVRRPGARG